MTLNTRFQNNYLETCYLYYGSASARLSLLNMFILIGRHYMGRALRTFAAGDCSYSVSKKNRNRTETAVFMKTELKRTLILKKDTVAALPLNHKIK